MEFKWYRVSSVILRYFYANRRTVSTFFDYFYWPLIDILLFGYIGTSLSSHTSGNNLVLSLLSGMVLWQVAYRTNLEISKNMMQELWDENLINFFATPLQPFEWILSLMIMGPLTVLLTVPYGALIVYISMGQNIFTIGWFMLVLIGLLIMAGWILGIITSSFLIRYGQKIDTLIWAIGWLPAPFCSVYYPVETLPGWMQTISKLMPMTYAFEAMRIYIKTNAISYYHVGMSLGMNIVYLIAALIFFFHMFNKSKERGLNTK
jgi:ABC-2 type transport system permease protein